MIYDVVIKNGTIVDGTGASSYTADLAIRDGKIVEIGKVGLAADMVIDAEEAIVTPGFIDPHTHYDGQATWDDELRPSSVHGITTAVMGNCGVGFAPVRPGEEARLVSLMEGVEDIPGGVLTEGMRWGWTSYGDYLDALELLPRTIDVAAYVPHDPVRLFVMGDRAAAREPANEDDIAAMGAIVSDALRAGAIGFSTGRTDVHRTADGHDTPASIADRRELTAIAAGLRGVSYRTIAAVSDFDLALGESSFEAEFDVIEDMARASGRPLTLSFLQRLGAPDQWRQILKRTANAEKAGADIRLQCAPRGIGTLLGLSTTFNPLLAFAPYERIANLPLAAQASALLDPDFRADVLAVRPRRLSEPGNSIPPIVDEIIQNLETVAARMFPLAGKPDYEPAPEDSILARARAQGKPVLAVFLDALAADQGKAFVYFPIYNYMAGNFDVVEEMLNHPRAQLGLGDAGAHVATISDGAYSSFFLQHWVRDRTRGPLLPLERAVRMLSGDQADFFGMADRGRLKPGLRADLNVIDLQKLELGSPYMVGDLPAGGKRLLQEAHGYRATLVGGCPILQNGKLTGAKPGRVVRACAM